MTPIQTDRLTLIPCPAAVAVNAYGGKRQLESLLNAHFDAAWLDDDGRALLGFYGQQISSDPTLLGWGLWLIQQRDQRVIFGSAGFKGKPDQYGVVEIGYGIAPAFRRQGYTFEAASALVAWAFAHPDVAYVRAEALEDNHASLRILEKLGMRFTQRCGSYLMWELKRP